MRKEKITAAFLLLVLTAELLAGCQKKETPVKPLPPEPETVRSESLSEISSQEMSSLPPASDPIFSDPDFSRPLPSSSEETPSLFPSEPSSEFSSEPSSEPDFSRPEQVHPHHAFYKSIWEKELAYLASMQLSNGAFPKTKTSGGKAAVNAYFSNAVCMALLDAESTYQQEVKAYLLWHIGHLNTKETDYNGLDGTIYDYWIYHHNGTVEKEELQDPKQEGHGHYDSTDSLSSTFLTLLEKYAEKTGDTEFIRQHASVIDRKVAVLRATTVGGLTLAKPDYPILYLMDNCETYEGFAAAARLYLLLGEKEKAAEADRDAKAVKDAIFSRMRNEKGPYYEPALNKAGRPVYSFDWENWYPSATSQLFLIHKGLLAPDSAEAKSIYSRFNAHYSTGEKGHSWDQMDLPVQFYWCIVPYTAALMGDEERLYSYFSHYQERMTDHAYPLYNADIAKAAMAAYRMMVQTA